MAKGSLDQVLRKGRDCVYCCAPPMKPGDKISVYAAIEDKPRGWFMAQTVNPKTRQVFGLLPPGTKAGDFLIVQG